MLDLLQARDCRATFFCIAERARAHPDLCREMARRGHGIENHSLAHRNTFALLTLAGIRRELLEAQAALAGGRQAGNDPRDLKIAPLEPRREPVGDARLRAAGYSLSLG